MESDRSTVAPSETVVNGPGTADEFPAPANRGDVNKKGQQMIWIGLQWEEMR